MFKNLFNLTEKRTKAEIFGFYLFYVIVGMVLIGLVSGLIVMVMHISAGNNFDLQNSVEMGQKFGQLMGLAYVGLFGFYIVSNKNLTKNTNAVILLVASVALTWVLGLLIGFIPLSFLTKFDSVNR